MRVAMLTPLPPTRTGVAHYASMILPALASRMEIEAFDRGAGFSRQRFDAVIYQLGNNPHHEFAYREAMEHPGIAVLHDVVLHHLIVEMTLARGDEEGYIEALRREHGEAGAAWARGRANGLHSEMGNFLFPASIEVARRSRAVIVHNEYAAERLRSFGVETPVHVVGHPYVADASPIHRYQVRGLLGFHDDDRVIGLFGFLTTAKRGEVVIEAFRRARARRRNLRLLIVGEAAPNIDVESLRGEGLTMTGYVSDENFGAYYRAADLLVNLRYPSAGETSGTLIRAFDAGKPVAVSDYAQFAEFPDACVTKIPLGEGEIESLEKFFLSDFDEKKVASAQRQWLEEHATLEKTAEGYTRALSAAPPTPAALVSHPTIALFPNLELVTATRDASRITIRLHNTGPDPLRAREYGSPGYRVIARLFAGRRHLGDRWLALPRDVEAGEAVSLDVDAPPEAATLELHHALESIPHLEGNPWARAELPRV